MTMLSKFETLLGSDHIYKGVNNTARSDVTIIKESNGWTLDIAYVTGECHESFHDTWDEAVREAETQTCWTVTFT